MSVCCRSKALAVLGAGLLSFQLMAGELPLPPELESSPYPNVPVTELASATGLVSLYHQINYQLSDVESSSELPAIYVENLPKDLNALPTDEKSQTFIRLLLPTIVAVNNEILAARKTLIGIIDKSQDQWTEDEKAWMAKMLKDYGVKANDYNELLLQVDVIPVGMALAQAIDESGWGTSHFAVAGNNLYGEHLPSGGGKFLTTPGGHVKVAAFDSLFEGTASYIHNVNRTKAYRQLWLLRKKLRAKHELTGYELVGGLIHYSTRGQAYVDNLRALIKHHNLDSFDNVKVEDSSPEVIRFGR